MIQNTFSCVVVDDSEVIVLMLKKFIEKTEFLHLEQTFTDPLLAFDYLQDNNVDILLLDIEMPQMSGFELLKALHTKPQTIMITSNRDFALEAYQLDVTDYLVKPPDYSRFLHAIDKAKHNLSTAKIPPTQQQVTEQEIYVKVENKLIRLTFDAIMYVEAMSDYIIIHTEDKRQYIVYSTLKAFEERLRADNHRFIRIHRSYMVNMDKIDMLEDNSVVINGKNLAIGITYKDDFMRILKRI